jgi:monoterpene epsilon-lactone hydrolase
MNAVIDRLRTIVVAVVALVAAVGRRLRNGPLVEGWTWGVELRRAMISALLAAGMRSAPPARWADLRVEAPLPGRLRDVIAVETSSVGGVPGEWLRLTSLPGGRAALLYFHGGGHVMGHPGMERPFVAELVAAARADAFSVDYRLAPGNPFPAALDDAVVVYSQLLASGVDPAMLVVAGTSAGGNLAAALLVRLRDEGRPLPAGAVLFSPWLDLAGTGASLVSNAGTDYLPELRGVPAGLYLGDADPTNPHASPFYADPAGLPPLLLFAGGREILLDDSVRFAEKAENAGVEVTLHVEPAMYHAWAAVIPRHPASRRAILIAADWMGRLTGLAR